ncbi:FxLYD domain-containing protein [Streptomyces lincolnensis]|uniref:FxLYD domain-containing protein n=1 Tax=Streptomyces lincolnensis TaxID=1915 RepID=UPI0037D6AE80
MVVLLLIAAGVVGVMAVNDATKDGGPLADATASAPAQSDEPYDEPNQDTEGTPAAEEPTDEPSDASGPEGDVKITQCEVDSLTTWASAEVTITNSTEQTASYVVSVEFVDSSGKRVGDALAATENLAPGQEAEETAQGLDTIKGKIDCKVTEVTRYEQ